MDEKEAKMLNEYGFSKDENGDYRMCMPMEWVVRKKKNGGYVVESSAVVYRQRLAVSMNVSDTMMRCMNDSCRLFLLTLLNAWGKLLLKVQDRISEGGK